MPTALLRRAAAALALMVLGAGAQAACTGPSLLEGLDPARLEEIRAASAATPYGQGLLWSARRGDARILVAGTMHYPDPRHEATLAALAPALRKAGLLLLETTPEEEGAMARAIAERPELAVITEGPTLPELMPPEDWERLAEAARARGMPPFLAAKSRPWLLMVTLSLPPCAIAALAEGGRGLDHLLMDLARAEGVPLAALEPWDTVFGLMSRGTLEEQVEALGLLTVDPAPAERMLVAMVEGYFAGRIAEVWELSRLSAELLPQAGDPAQAAAFAEIEADLLFARNEAWVPVIEAASRETPRLVVAAGAAHLPGERGLLRLLEEEGWAIAPLEGEACCEGFWEAP